MKIQKRGHRKSSTPDKYRSYSKNRGNNRSKKRGKPLKEIDLFEKNNLDMLVEGKTIQIEEQKRIIIDDTTDYNPAVEYGDQVSQFDNEEEDLGTEYKGGNRTLDPNIGTQGKIKNVRSLHNYKEGTKSMSVHVGVGPEDERETLVNTDEEEEEVCVTMLLRDELQLTVRDLSLYNTFRYHSFTI